MATQEETITDISYDRRSKRILIAYKQGDIMTSNRQLTQPEILIFEKLIYAYPETVSRRELLIACWPERVVSGSSLSVSMCNIRNALSEFGKENLIITIPKKGYKINDDDKALISRTQKLLAAKKQYKPESYREVKTRMMLSSSSRLKYHLVNIAFLIILITLIIETMVAQQV